MARRSHLQKLTPEESEFAAEHCDQINRYMRNFALPDEFYGSAAEGYLRAVKKWFACPELHKWAFSTIVKNAIRSTVGSEMRYNNTHNPHIIVYLDDFLSGADDFTLADTIPNPASSVEDLICIRETISEALLSRGNNMKIPNAWEFERMACI